MSKRKIIMAIGLSLLITVVTSGIAKAAPAGQSSIKRIYGDSPIKTAIEVAKELKSNSNTYVIATVDQYPDALAGTVLAAKCNAPILFVSKGDSAEIFNYLKSANTNKDTTFYILGGLGAVSQSVEEGLTSISKNVFRLGGSNRFETCKIINDTINQPEGTPVIIATGENYPDALSISAIGGQLKYPILLVNKQDIPKIIEAKLQEMNPSKVYIVGGKGGVSESVEAQVKDLIDTEFVRFAGTDRYDTSMKIAEYFKSNVDKEIYATGTDFHDALLAAPLAVANKAAIILADNENFKKQATVSRHKGFIMGSPQNLSNEVLAKMTGSSAVDAPTNVSVTGEPGIVLNQFKNCTTMNSSL